MPTTPPAGPESTPLTPRNPAASTSPPLLCISSSGGATEPYRRPHGRNRARSATAPGTGTRRRRWCRRARRNPSIGGGLVRRDDFRETQLARRARRPAARARGSGSRAGTRSPPNRSPATSRHAGRAQSRHVQRRQHGAGGIDAFVGFDDAAIERCGAPDRARKDVGPLLVADPQRVAKAARRHQHRRLAFALEQRVRRDRRAEPHRFQRRAPPRACVTAARRCRGPPRRRAHAGRATAPCGSAAGRRGSGPRRP